MARRCSSRFVRVTSSIKRSVEAWRSRRICSNSFGNPGGHLIKYLQGSRNRINQSASRDQHVDDAEAGLLGIGFHRSPERGLHHVARQYKG